MVHFLMSQNDHLAEATLSFKWCNIVHLLKLFHLGQNYSESLMTAIFVLIQSMFCHNSF